MATFSYVNNTLAELADRCHIPKANMKQVNLLSSSDDILLCKICNNITTSRNVSRVLTGVSYASQGDKIYKQNVMMCSLCYDDYNRIAKNNLLTQQNENSNSLSPFVFPQLETIDTEYKATYGIVNKYLFQIYQCVYDKNKIDNMVNNVVESIYSNDIDMVDDDGNNNNNDNRYQHQYQKPKINLYDLILEEYATNHNVRSFFYNNEKNINRFFKRLWPIRHQLQKYV